MMNIQDALQEQVNISRRKNPRSRLLGKFFLKKFFFEQISILILL